MQNTLESLAPRTTMATLDKMKRVHGSERDHATCRADARRLHELHPLTAGMLKTMKEIESMTVEGGAINTVTRAAIAKFEGRRI